MCHLSIHKKLITWVAYGKGWGEGKEVCDVVGSDGLGYAKKKTLG